MITKITIDRIFTNRESKAGKKFSSPKVDIYFKKDDKEFKVSQFVNESSPALTWQKGDEVEIDVFKKGEYYNFKDPAGNLADRVAKLEEDVRELKGEKLDEATDTDELHWD